MQLIDWLLALLAAAMGVFCIDDLASGDYAGACVHAFLFSLNLYWAGK